MRVLLALAAAVSVLAAGCSSDDNSGAESVARPAELIEDAVTRDGLRAHLKALQRIADEHDGTRASGTPGYDASVEYVVAELREAGYKPQVHRFRYTDSRELEPPELTRTSPEAVTYAEGEDFIAFRYSGGGDVAAQLQAVDADSETSGCEPSDFDGFEQGAAALLRRGGCFFVVKVANAASAGAAAVLVFNDGSPGHKGPLEATLVRPADIPALSLANDVGEELVAQAAQRAVRMQLTTSVETVQRESANVLADLAGMEDVAPLLIGAHLDSVASGPGINDNGSGVAALLEIAEQARRLGFRPQHPVRFAFWAGEEAGLVGSAKYVESLGDDPEAEVAAVVNLDMVGSPNAEAFVYQGDATIEDALAQAVRREDLEPLPVDLQGRSDHGPFAEAGIPVGGLFTGADDLATNGEPHDACYHQACDTLENVDIETLERMADALAVAVFAHLTSVRW
jgi:Zn-dependent M28 family amino/carboxypeptidase